MKRILFLIPALLLGFCPLSNAQEGYFSEEDEAFLAEMEDTLSLLAYAVINDSLEENRFGACREMIPRLVKALKVENSFHYPFEQLKSVSIQYPKDSTFRLFTWQLYVNKDEYRYYGAIQMNSPELKLYPLVDRSFNIQDEEHAVLAADEWYGSVYYNIKQVKGEEVMYYTLFGFDAFSFFRKRKIIDVLSFNEQGEPVFGAPVFVKEQGPVKSRIIQQYSAEVSTRCNYDELLEMIIFDHLITLSGPHGEGPVQYPDGSYEGYELKNGKWMHKEKVFDQVSDEAPRPAPILDHRTKDIFGN